MIASGKLRALAVTGPKRVAALPNVPTVVEQGFPNLVVEDWVGFAVKNGTPSDIVAKLNVVINNALAKPIIRDTFVKLGAEPGGGAPSESGTFSSCKLRNGDRWSKSLASRCRDDQCCFRARLVGTIVPAGSSLLASTACIGSGG